MKKTEMTEIILAAKKQSKLTWAALADRTGMSEVYVASCCYGENSMVPETAEKLCAALDLDESGEVRRWHHERDRLHDGGEERRKLEGRPRRRRHERQVPPL
jgi:cyanate lyase